MATGDVRRIQVTAEILIPESTIKETTKPDLDNMPAILSDGLVEHYGTGAFLLMVGEIRERTEKAIGR